MGREGGLINRVGSVENVEGRLGGRGSSNGRGGSPLPPARYRPCRKCRICRMGRVLLVLPVPILPPAFATRVFSIKGSAEFADDNKVRKCYNADVCA